jgi:hypothetical protein
VSKSTSYLRINAQSIPKFQLPWHNYGNDMFKPEYSEKKLLELLKEANPDVNIKKLKLGSDNKGTFVEVVYKGQTIQVPENLKKCFE